MKNPLPLRIDVQGDWPGAHRPGQLGIIVVDHGSRRDESNQYIIEIATLYQQQTEAAVVEPAHMELAQPDIAAAYDRCVKQGAKYVVVHPYFLAPGRHWHEHIPALSKAAAARHPETACIVTAPLGLHHLMIDIMHDRIQQAVDNH